MTTHSRSTTARTPHSGDGAPVSARYPPIAEYALLADCHSAALVHRRGSIDWACLRRFDAGSVFARLLDWDRGGHFAVRVVDADEPQRGYVDGTLVLETAWNGPTGTAVARDAFAMHPGGRDAPRHQLLRTIACTGGRVEVEVELMPRFDYGDLRPWLRRVGAGVVVAVGGDEALVLVTDVDPSLDRDEGRLHGRVTLTEGEQVRCSLLSQPSHAIDPGATRIGEVEARLDQTIRWWQRWSQDTTAPDRHGAAVRRSACVLKGLTCAPTGSIVAAPTASLPEQLGGGRNWDYRYTWIRDATLTMDALDRAGHREVASGFRQFLMRATAGDACDLQIMYGPYGGRRLPEQELDLAGYRDSRPVRIGNAAASQVQLDVYGHILDAAYHWQRDGTALTTDEWWFLRRVVDRAAEVWQEPDRGIWEMRGEPRHFVHSKVMLWVALDRGIRLVEEGVEGHAGGPGGDGAKEAADVDRWRAVRDRLRAAVEDRGVDPDGGWFTQAFDTAAVDASLLKLATVGFVDACDPRMIATVDAIRDQLATDDGFVRRYATTGADGLAGDEGTFLLCSFWMVEVLAAQGRLGEAEALFDRLLGVGNDLGLFAEEYDPEAGLLLGNFPQAFTHLGLVNAAFQLAAARGGQRADERSDTAGAAG
jgi:GH15 family glucan-1,4-alpha-glucosidase